MAPLRVPTSTVLNLQQPLSPSLFVRKRGNGQLSTTRRGEGAARREGARGARHGVAQAVPSVVVVLVCGADAAGAVRRHSLGEQAEETVLLTPATVC